MSANSIRWAAILGLAGVVAIAGWLRMQRAEQLRSELDLRKEQQRERAQLLGENQRLRAHQTPAAELTARRAAHEELERLRNEVDLLRARDQASGNIPSTAPAEPITAAQSLAIPASEWKNAGRVTPSAAIETALWAASGGDLDTLTQTILLDDETRAKTLALLRGLPAAAQTQYRSPEHLLALLTAKDVPLGAMQIVAQSQISPEQVMMRLRLHQPDGAATSTSLLLRKTADEWRLVVPPSAVDKYAAALKGKTAAP